MIAKEEFRWKSEFQYLLDIKILSRAELAYLFSQIQSIINRSCSHQQKKIDELERDALKFPTLVEFSNLQGDYEKSQQKIDGLKKGINNLPWPEYGAALEAGCDVHRAWTYFVEACQDHIEELLKEQ